MTISNDSRDARIVELVKQGSSLTAAGKMFGISRERARQICAREGVVSQRAGRGLMWTDAERNKFRELVARGLPYEHCLPEGRKSNGSGVAKRLGCWEPRHHQDDWSKSDEAFIRAHYNKGKMSAAQIGAKIGRNRNEVIGKAHRMGLGKATP